MEENREPEMEKVSAEDLIELYGLFGLFGKEKTQRVRKDELSRDYEFGIDSAIYHLWSEDRIRFTRTDRLQLSEDEQEVAENIADEIYWNDRTAEELIREEEVPEYLSEPETSEELNAPLENGTQSPDEDFYKRILEVLNEEPLKAREVEERLVGEINFDIEPRLRYLESQGLAERYEDGYRLSDNFELRDRLKGEKINLEGWLMDADRYGNDPWKP